jgi:hypothetical protein
VVELKTGRTARGATMIDNPIVDEIHRIRGEILAEYGGDIHRLTRDDQRKTE